MSEEILNTEEDSNEIESQESEQDVDSENIEDENIEDSEEEESSENSDSSQEKMNSVIAGVKKKFRQKGYDEGYLKAKEELLNSNIDKSENDQPEKFDPELQKLIFRDMEISAKKVRMRGIRKFKDFDEKVMAMIPLGRKNANLSALFEKAMMLEDPDIVYKLASDKPYRQKLLAMEDPDMWDTALYDFEDQKKPSKKPPPSPIEGLKTKSLKASDGEPSDAEKIEVLRRNGLI